VDVCWLWRPKEYYTFDFGHRIGSFAPYVTEAPFLTPLSEKVSEAVETIRRYQEIVQQPAATADALSTMPLLERSEHKLYNAAVASAVAGRWEVARTLAAKIRGRSVPAVRWL
jgi:hypothetical protein